MKNNVLPFPSLMAAPRDPPKPTLWRGLVALVIVVIGMGLFALTLSALFL